MNQEQIEKGTYGVLLTPFDRKGHLEEQALRMELRHCAGTHDRAASLWFDRRVCIYGYRTAEKSSPYRDRRMRKT